MIKDKVQELTVDVLIIGGGLVGATLMLALMSQGYNVLLVDEIPLQQGLKPKSEESSFDARTLALAPSSITILQQLQVWPLVSQEACPIQRIHVSQQGHFGISELHGKLDEDLGCVLELQLLNNACYQQIPADKLLAPAEFITLNPLTQIATVKQGEQEFAIKATLVIAADGGHSAVRSALKLPATIKQYTNYALVANIALQRSHQHCAYERFTRDGSLAMLPMTKLRAAMVWCVPKKQAKLLQAMDEKLFLKELQRTFGYRLGRLIKAGKRSLFPLQEILMPTQAQWPVVFIGNAAHTLHPVAAQGFNLGLRDVAALAQCIVSHGLNEAMLKQYLTMRRADQSGIIRGTDGLVRVFASSLPGVAWARGVGLFMLDNLNFLQQWGARYPRGYGGIVPDLVCGIPLEPPL